MNSEITFGAWLKRRRRQMDLTQKELAILVSCGLGTLRKIENGSRRPSKELATYIGKALDIPEEQMPAFVAFARSDPDMETVQLPDFAQEQIRPSQPSIPTPTATIEATKIRNNLPPQPTPFIGRSAEIDILDEFLTNPDNRLITILGPGGMGKTRLALAYAEQQLASTPESSPPLFPDGLFFIDLAPLMDPRHIITTMAKALELKLQNGRRDDRTPREQLLDYLRDKQLLLIMDNLEHLIAAPNDSQSEVGMISGVNLVTDILQTAPAAQIIVTSRKRLRLRQEQLYLIQGLEIPDWEKPEVAVDYAAVRLFLHSAQRNHQNFSLVTHEELSAIVRICQLVGGMPLALELAASWVGTLSLVDIAAELQHGLDILETELRDVPKRQRSVRATFDYSWRKLDDKEQSVFAQLSIFRGGFTRPAAQAVTAATLRELSQLVNSSFIQFNRRRDRYQVHELLRQYGAEKLGQDSELERAARDRHSAYYSQTLGQYTNDLKGARQQQALAAIEADFENVRLAWNHAVTRLDLTAIGISLEALYRFYWHQSSYLRDGINDFEKAAAILRAGKVIGARDVVLGRLLATLGWLFSKLGQNGKAIELAKESLCLLLRQGVREETLMPLLCLAMNEESLEESNRLLRESLTLAREIGDQWAIGDALLRMGVNARAAGDYEQAEQLWQESLQHFRHTGDKGGIVWTLAWLSVLAGDLGRYEDALALARETVALVPETNSPETGFYSLGRALYDLGAYEEAEEQFQQRAALNREADLRCDFHEDLFFLGKAAFRMGDCALATQRYQESLAGALEFDDLEFVAQNHDALGRLCVAQGAGIRAREHSQAALRAAITFGQSHILPDCLATVAELFAKEGDLQYAALLAMLVSNHPASRAKTKERGSHLLTYLEAQLSSHDLANLRQRRALDLGVTVSELLVELDASQGMNWGGDVTKPKTAVVEATTTFVPALDYRLTPIHNERFVQEELIAVGGMGEVYNGRDSSTGQFVAIKRLKPELAAGNPDLLARFAREGEALRQLNHPNIVQVLATIEDEKAPAIIMEYVPGGDLQALLEAESPLPLAKALNIALELADALSRAHHLGIIHRDLKPANVLLAEDGTPRLTDFGLARLDQRQTRLTQQGAMIGSPAYMSPELFQGEEADQSSDIWSFGVLLYELLAGLNPFDKPTISATLVAILNQDLPDIAELRADVPPPLAELLQQMLVKERTQRLDSARQVAATLERILQAPI